VRIIQTHWGLFLALSISSSMSQFLATARAVRRAFIQIVNFAFATVDQASFVITTNSKAQAHVTTYHRASLPQETKIPAASL